MSDDFSDIDGGHEPLFAEYEDEDIGDVPALPPPLAILNSPTGGAAALDNVGDNNELSFTQQTNLFADEAADTSRNDQSTAGAATKKRKPLLVYNEGRITSPRGLKAIMEDFPNIRFMGKGHEKSDLKLLMVNYEEWANRMFPKMAFDDIIDRTEKLGAKKEVKSLLHQLRNGITPAEEEVIDDDDHMIPGLDHVGSGVDHVSTDAPVTGVQENTTANSDSDFPDDLPFGDDVIDQGNAAPPSSGERVDEWPEDVMDDLPMVDINGMACPSNQRTAIDMDTSHDNDKGVDDQAVSPDNDQSHQDSSLTCNTHIDDQVCFNSQSHQDSPLMCDDQALEDDHQNVRVGQGMSHHNLDPDSSVCVDNNSGNSNQAHVDPDTIVSLSISNQNDSLADHTSDSESLTLHDQQSQDQCTVTDASESSTQTESCLTNHDQGSHESSEPQDKSQHTLIAIDNQYNSFQHETDDHDQTDHLFNDISIDDFISDEV